MSDDPRWLRATLDPDPVPPPDLADRAERTARGILRRRTAAGALAVAAVVAVPLAVHGTRAPDPTAVPAATLAPSPTPPGSCDEGGGRYFAPENPPGRARSAAEADWAYRGDAGLRDRAAALGAGMEEVRPLFGEALPGGGTVLMVAGRRGADWRLRYAVDGTEAGSAEQALPALGPSTALSLVLAPATEDLAAVLVVVAAPGTTGITYRYCEGPTGYRLRTGVAADTAVLPMRTNGQLPGELTVERPGGTWDVGQPGTGYAGAFGEERLDPIPVPAGYRAVGPVVAGPEGLEYRGEETVLDARVLARCWDPYQFGLGLLGGDPTRPLRCDGLVQVVEDGVSFSAPRQLAFPIPAQAEVVVVVPDR